MNQMNISPGTQNLMTTARMQTENWLRVSCRIWHFKLRVVEALMDGSAVQPWSSIANIKFISR